MTKPVDDCPKWAEELILKIRAMEIQLGNIRPGMTSSKADEAWQSQELGKLLDRLGEDGDTLRLTEEAVEGLFRKVAKDLTAEGFTPAQIVAFVNSRVAPESRLPYCDAREVMEALAGS